jgi:hypothetical protein
MSDTSQAGPPPGSPAEPPRPNVSRAAGLGIGAATALIVFIAGSMLFPASKSPEPTVAVAPPKPLRPVQPRPTESTSPVDAASADLVAPDGTAPESPSDQPKNEKVALAGEGDDRPIATSDALTEIKNSVDSEPSDSDLDKKKRSGKKRGKDSEKASSKHGEADGDPGSAEAKEDNTPLPPSDGSASGGNKDGSADCALPEKDIAREAWRRNWPTICAVGATGKAFILIPLKGALEGEIHELRRRPTREARVVLPAGAESLLTMKQYKVKKMGFKELRVSASEGGGSRLRVKLQPGAGDPVFEIKDGYAKITISTPGKD